MEEKLKSRKSNREKKVCNTLVPLFAMEESYSQISVPSNRALNLYRVSQFTSEGRAISPDGRLCNYLAFVQTLGNLAVSYVVLANETFREIIWLTESRFNYKVSWELQAVVDLTIRPDLRVVLVKDQLVGFEAFDVCGDRIRFTYPNLRGEKTRGSFTLAGWDNVFVVYSNTSDLKMSLRIKAFERPECAPNPFRLGKFKVNGVPAYEITQDPVNPSNFLRIVYPEYQRFARRVRREYLSQSFQSCSSSGSNSLTERLLLQQFSTIKMKLIPDIRQLSDNEKDCITISRMLIGGAVSILILIIFVLVGSTSDAIQSEAQEFVHRWVKEVSSNDFIGTGLEVVDENIPKRSSSDLEAGVYEIDVNSTAFNICLSCGISLYVDCALLDVMGSNSENFMKYYNKSRTFNLTLAGTYSITIDIGLNFNRTITSGTQRFGASLCPSPPYFSIERAKTRNYLTILNGESNPRPVSFSNRAATYFSLSEKTFDYILNVTYIINHDPGYESDPLCFTVRNGAAYLVDNQDSITALSTNMCFREIVSSNGGINYLGISKFDVTIDFIRS